MEIENRDRDHGIFGDKTIRCPDRFLFVWGERKRRINTDSEFWHELLVDVVPSIAIVNISREIQIKSFSVDLLGLYFPFNISVKISSGLLHIWVWSSGMISALRTHIWSDQNMDGILKSPNYTISLKKKDI